MAMEGDDRLYEARVWQAFHAEFPDIRPEAVTRVLEDHFDELDKTRPDQQLDLLVKLAGGRPQPPTRSEERREAEGWKPHRNPDAPLTTADIVMGRAANRRDWQAANGSKIAERRRAEAPLDDARKEIARLKASREEDAA